MTSPDTDVTSCVVMLKPLDVIELRVAVDSWQEGTIATVLEVAPASVLAEVADENGTTLEILTVPVEAARRLEPQDVPRRPKTSGAPIIQIPCISGLSQRKRRLVRSVAGTSWDELALPESAWSVCLDRGRPVEHDVPGSNTGTTALGSRPAMRPRRR